MAIKPIIDSVATIGNSLLLVDLKPAFERIKNSDGDFEKTDRITHYNYTVVCLEKKFEKISVKVEEIRPLFDIEKEEIPENTYVKFDNLTLTPYVSNGWIQLSSKADKCMVVKA
ncbi:MULTISPECIES: hypothetical protein [Lactobacillales]|nr:MULTISPECIES: hypothetical protein [Lactobacillales]EGO2515262.1 hypothetical protein [Enterococcus faecalis]EGO5965106.1 hypothetical protein [Enterococcus faecalis]EGO7501550.1 hypothetical protein [Enterococcus faecalis]EGO8537731.1 hypothetical protein [Enterococcus faecalis]EGO9238046.1 hypothetical protein [Enterococcus faecalis]